MTFTPLDQNAIRTLAPMRDVISAVKDALIRMELREFELPQRLSLDSGSSLIMPITHLPTSSSVTKVLSLDPDRNPFITGVTVWLGKNILAPVVADAATVTSLRTGAITGVAVDLLAEDNVKTLTIFGAGVQSYDQVRAILAVRDLETVTIIDQNTAKAVAVAETLASEYIHTEFRSNHDRRHALHEADIVACATTSTSQLFSASELSISAVVTAIGSYRPHMHELPQDLIATGCPIYVDDVNACLHESGEVIRAIETGVLHRDDIVTLGQALMNGVQRGGRSIFKSVGIAAQDWAIMRTISGNINQLDLEAETVS